MWLRKSNLIRVHKETHEGHEVTPQPSFFIPPEFSGTRRVLQIVRTRFQPSAGAKHLTDAPFGVPFRPVRRRGASHSFEEFSFDLTFILHMPRRRIFPLILLCLLAFAGRAARADAPGGKDFGKAEAVLAKLNQLEEAAASHDPDEI